MSLWCIGLALNIASRVSARLRAQLSRDMVISLTTRDGIGRTFHIEDRRVSSAAGTSESAACRLTFPSASAGTRILFSANAVEQIVRGLASGDIELRGLPAHVLWFYELIVGCLPRRRHNAASMPGAYRAPDPRSRVADRIVREPSVAALDERFTDAVGQRAKLNIWQVGRRAPIPGRIDAFQHLVRIPDVDSGTRT